MEDILPQRKMRKKRGVRGKKRELKAAVLVLLSVAYNFCELMITMKNMKKSKKRKRKEEAVLREEIHLQKRKSLKR